MTEILSYFPGMQVTIFLEVVDGYGGRADSPSDPMVDRVILPALTLANGYPQIMTRLDVGLYVFHFVLPTGAASVGSYLVDVSFTNPDIFQTNYRTYQVIVTAPFGNYGLTVVTTG